MRAAKYLSVLVFGVCSIPHGTPFLGRSILDSVPVGNHLRPKMKMNMQKIDAAHFREVLTQEGKKRWNMDYNELHRLCLER